MRCLSRSASVLFTLFALTACTAAPKVDTIAEGDAVRVRSEGIAAAEAAMDREKSLTFWAKDAIVQPAGAPQITGHDAISALYKQFFEASGMKTFSGTTSQITVAASGDLAYETGVNRMTFGSPKGDLLDVGKYLTVWKKVDGGWYVAALSFTSDAPAPVPIAAKP